jgi:hypothetical protein
MTDISRDAGGSVVIEFADGVKEYITNTKNVQVKGKVKPKKNADFDDDAEVRVSRGNESLYTFLLSDLTVGGVAPADLQAGVDAVAEVFQDVAV